MNLHNMKMSVMHQCIIQKKNNSKAWQICNPVPKAAAEAQRLKEPFQTYDLFQETYE